MGSRGVVVEVGVMRVKGGGVGSRGYRGLVWGW